MLEVPLHVLLQFLVSDGFNRLLQIVKVLVHNGTYNSRIFLLFALLAFLGETLTLGVAEHLGEQLGLQRKGGVGRHDCGSNDDQGVIQTADVTQPFQEAVGLALNPILIHGQCDIRRSYLVVTFLRVVFVGPL